MTLRGGVEELNITACGWCQLQRRAVFGRNGVSACVRRDEGRGYTLLPDLEQGVRHISARREPHKPVGSTKTAWRCTTCGWILSPRIQMWETRRFGSSTTSQPIPIRCMYMKWFSKSWTDSPLRLWRTMGHIMDVQLAGPARPPEAWETGSTDTVIAYPGEVTRIRAQFNTPGQFVWHCHIVEHEDNEMMRPYRIGPEQPGQPLPPTEPM